MRIAQWLSLALLAVVLAACGPARSAPVDTPVGDSEPAVAASPTETPQQEAEVETSAEVEAQAVTVEEESETTTQANAQAEAVVETNVAEETQFSAPTAAEIADAVWDEAATRKNRLPLEPQASSLPTSANTPFPTTRFCPAGRPKTASRLSMSQNSSALKRLMSGLARRSR